MRHDHPRGEPNTTAQDWCKACVTEGITTFDELTRTNPPRRGKVKVGMTVKFWFKLPNPTGSFNPPQERREGQVWSLAEPDHRGVWSSGIEYWWIVTDDGVAHKVRQDQLTVVDKEQAGVRLM